MRLYGNLSFSGSISKLSYLSSAVVIRAGVEFMLGPGLGPQIARAFAGSAGLRIFGMAVGFLVGVQLARGLGAEGYGVYGLAMSLIALLAVPAECGLPQLVTREAAVAKVENDWARFARLMQWSTRSSICLAIVVWIFAIAAAFATNQDIDSGLSLTVLAGLVMLPLVALMKINGAALRGMQKIVPGQISEVLIRPLLFSLLLFLVPVFLIPLSAPIAMVLGALSAGIAMLVTVVLRRRLTGGHMVRKSSGRYPRDWWSSSIPMAVTEGIRVLQGHLVILLLGLMSTEASVGVFRVSNSVSVMVGVSITVVNIVNAPLVAKFFTEQDEKRLQRLLSWSALAMTFFTFLLIVPFIFAGEFLLGAVFGSEFSSGAPALLVLLIGLLANSFFGSSATVLNMTGYQSKVTRNSAISLIFLMLFSPIFIGLSGIEGAAWASAVTYVLWNFLMWRDVRRFLRIDASVFSMLQRSAF